MKSMILAAVLAGAIAGGGSALIAGAVLSGSEASKEPAAVSPGDDLTAGLADELRQIREQNQALADQMRELEMRLAAVRNEGPRQVATEPEPNATDAEELQELVAVLRDPSSPPPANFTESVGRALEQIREEEDRERDERRQEAFQERLDERLADLALELGLTQDQTNDLRDLYVDMSVRQREMMEAARELDDWGSMRDQMRGLRDEMQESLAKVMSPNQLERYEELGGSGRSRGFGGGMLPPSTDDRGGNSRGNNRGGGFGGGGNRQGGGGGRRGS